MNSEPHTITKHDLKQMRGADYVSAWYSLHSGESKIELDIKHKVNDNFTAEECYIIPLPSCGQGKFTTCRASNGFAQYPEWQAIAWSLKVGDAISLRWQPDNNNQHMRGVGFHADECWLAVSRGKHRFMFLIDSQVGPHNTARMCR